MIIPIDEKYLLRTLRDLVRINSINPDLIEGAPGEKEIAEYIHQQLIALDIATTLEILPSGRPNVIARLPGRSNGPSLMINAHTDTVGVSGMKDPFSGEIRNGKLYGRGAQDMKGSIAAMLSVAKAIREADLELAGDLVLTFVADEEYGSTGSEAIVRRLRTDAVIVTEPTDLDVCIAHKGFGLFELKTFGRAAHGGRYQEGLDANRKMGKILAGIDALAGRLMRSHGHPLLGPPSLHVPRLSGGSEPFVYAAECTALIERRVLPGETVQLVTAEIEQITEALSREDPDLRVSLKKVLWRNPFEVSPDASIVQTVTTCTEAVRGAPPARIAHHWWEDAALFAEAGMETVVLGPAGNGLHSAEEWVDLRSVFDLARILASAACRYCNG